MSKNDPTLGKDQNRDVQEATQGQEEPRFIDPNSGAAPQPGGYAVGEPVPVPEPDDSDPVDPQLTGDPDVNAIHAAAIETSASPAGEQPDVPEEEQTGQGEGQTEEPEPADPELTGDPEADPARNAAVETQAMLGDVQEADGSPKEPEEGDDEEKSEDDKSEGDDDSKSKSTAKKTAAKKKTGKS